MRDLDATGKGLTLETEKRKLNFKSVHEGMGFHPFSDGLPYAPVSKSVREEIKKPEATIAEAENKKTFTEKNFPFPPEPNFKGSTPQARGAGATAAGRPQFNPTRTSFDQNKFRTATTAVPVSIAVKESKDHSTGIPRKRFFAYLLDCVVHALIWQIASGLSLAFTGAGFNWNLVTENPTFFFTLFYFTQFLFIGLQEGLFQTTIGKAFFGLGFKAGHSSLFLRSIVFHLGLLFAGLGPIFKIQDVFGEVIQDAE